MLANVAERGYEATTVPLVVATARVSRNAFYELFDDKIDCFLALCDELAGEMLDQLLGLAGADDWRAALRSGMALYLRWWQEHPEFSRTYLVELPAAGPPAVAPRDRPYARLPGMFEGPRGRARPHGPQPPPPS